MRRAARSGNLSQLTDLQLLRPDESVLGKGGELVSFSTLASRTSRERVEALRQEVGSPTVVVSGVTVDFAVAGVRWRAISCVFATEVDGNVLCFIFE